MISVGRERRVPRMIGQIIHRGEYNELPLGAVPPRDIKGSPACSLTTLRGSLSSRSPANFECRNLSASVHSRDSICATASGLNQTAFFIFSALSSPPNLDRLVSGKFINGQVGVTRCFNSGNRKHEHPAPAAARLRRALGFWS